MMQWAPPAFLGIEVNRLSGANSLPTHKAPASPENSSPATADASAPAPEAELSGIYFGILNIYSTIPQFMGAVMSGVVFYFFDAGEDSELAEEERGPNAISVCLFIGALSALISAYMTRRL